MVRYIRGAESIVKYRVRYSKGAESIVKYRVRYSRGVESIVKYRVRYSKGAESIVKYRVGIAGVQKVSGLWRVILSSSGLWWPNGSQMASGESS